MGIFGSVEKVAQKGVGLGMLPLKIGKSVLSTFNEAYAEQVKRNHEKKQFSYDREGLRYIGNWALYVMKQDESRPDLSVNAAQEVLFEFYANTDVELRDALDPHAAKVLESTLFLATKNTHDLRE